MTNRALSDEQCQLRLKRWLVQGLDDMDWGDNKRESHAVCFFCARKFWQIPAERKGHWPGFCLLSQNGELMHAVSSLCEGMLVR